MQQLQEFRAKRETERFLLSRKQIPCPFIEITADDEGARKPWEEREKISNNPLSNHMLIITYFIYIYIESKRK